MYSNRKLELEKGTQCEIEWLTLLLLLACYTAYGIVTVYAASLGHWVVVPCLSIVMALHSSLQHEVLHCHPFRNQRLNDLLVFLPVGVFVPYERFRTMHLAHHYDPNLTDPYDDPETNYLDPTVWRHLPWTLKRLCRLNNTLAGRMLVGPAIGLACFYVDDLKQITRGGRAVARAYLLHALGLGLVIVCLSAFASVTWWAYLLAAYFAMSLLKIRTFLEHRAHEKIRERTVIIEDRGPLALMFLNNNYHSVHHAFPGLAWYKLPGVFNKHRENIIARNECYYYASYGEIFRSFFFKPKDPVAHPLWSSDNRSVSTGGSAHPKHRTGAN